MWLWEHPAGNWGGAHRSIVESESLWHHLFRAARPCFLEGLQWLKPGSCSRMTPNGAADCGGGCRRGKVAHACAGAVAGFVACLLVVWATGGCGRSSSARVAEEEGMPGQFNLSTTQLQALLSLLSSTESECMGKSGLIHGGNQVNGMSCILDSLGIRDKTFDGKQNWLKDTMFQQFCTVQDKYGVNSHAPAVLEAKFFQDVIQEDISSTTQGNPHE